MSGNKTVGISAKRKQKPYWWQLYIMLPVLIGLFLGEMQLGLTGAANVIAQLGILFLVYASIHAWIRANHRALMEPDEQPGEWHFKVYEIRSADLGRALDAAERHAERPLLQLPAAELKGVLGSTFDLGKTDESRGLSVESELSRADELFSAKDTTDAKVR